MFPPVKGKVWDERAAIYTIFGRDGQLELAIGLIYETRMFAKFDRGSRVVSSRTRDLEWLSGWSDIELRADFELKS
jgi:hypothetical protein